MKQQTRSSSQNISVQLVNSFFKENLLLACLMLMESVCVCVFLQEESDQLGLRLFVDEQSRLLRGFSEQLEQCVSSLKQDVAAIVRRKRERSGVWAWLASLSRGWQEMTRSVRWAFSEAHLGWSWHRRIGGSGFNCQLTCKYLIFGTIRNYLRCWTQTHY